MWWQLAYLIPGLLLAAVIWEVAINGWTPKTLDESDRRLLDMLPMALEASGNLRLKVALYLFGVIVAWPILFLTAHSDDPGVPPTKKAAGKHRRR